MPKRREAAKTIEFWEQKEQLDRIEDWCRAGLSNTEISINMGISESTFYKWSGLSATLSEVITRGKAHSNAIIVNALFERSQTKVVRVRRAIKVKVTDYDNGKRIRDREEIVYADEDEVVPGDSKAAIFWLTHRDSHNWPDMRGPDITKAAEGAGGVVMLPPVTRPETPPEQVVEAEDMLPKADSVAGSPIG